MKKIILMRHAHSFPAQSGPDHHRLLSTRGRRDASAMGELLQSEGIVPDAVFCSSAQRTRETLGLVLENLHFAGEPQYSDTLYEAQISDYVDLLSALPDDVETALIVGHNPTMSSAFEFFSDRFQPFLPGAAAWLGFEIDAWADLLAEPIGKLLGYWEPKRG